MSVVSTTSLPARQQPISIIVPVYNEVENLRDLQAAVISALDPIGINFEVILINDGSTDGSTQLLDEIYKLDSRFRVIHFIRNYGQTAAMAAGIKHARNEILVSMDADLQNDPADIPLLLDHLDLGHDLVCGWRKQREDDFLLRKFPSRLANWLISKTTGVELHDYGCTLKAYRREYVEDIPLYGEMHRFIPIYVTWAGARMVEVPVNHRPRTKGESKYGLSRTFRVLLDLLTTVFLRDFYTNPLYFFGYYGFASIALGVLCAAVAVEMKYELGTWMHKNPLVHLAAMFLLLGFNSFFFGLLAEVIIRMNFDIQKKSPYRVRQVRGLEAMVPLIGRSQTPIEESEDEPAPAIAGPGDGEAAPRAGPAPPDKEADSGSCVA